MSKDYLTNEISSTPQNLLVLFSYRNDYYLINKFENQFLFLLNPCCKEYAIALDNTSIYPGHVASYANGDYFGFNYFCPLSFYEFRETYPKEIIFGAIDDDVCRCVDVCHCPKIHLLSRHKLSFRQKLRKLWADVDLWWCTEKTLWPGCEERAFEILKTL